MKSVMKILSLVALTFSVGAAYGAVKTGEVAPKFSVMGDDGKTHTLGDASTKGKVVVLEWYNEGCPYVKKYYNEGHMQALQAEYQKKGVVWYTVASSKPGSQGALGTPEEA